MVGRFCGGKYALDEAAVCCLGDGSEEAGRGMLGEVGMRGDMPSWSTRSFCSIAAVALKPRGDACGSIMEAMPRRVQCHTNRRKGRHDG